MGQLQQEIPFPVVDGQHPVLCQQAQGIGAQGDVAARKDFQGNALGRQPIPEPIQVLQDDAFLVDGVQVAGLVLEKVRGVATITRMPSATASLAISRASSRSPAPSFKPGRIWEWISIMVMQTWEPGFEVPILWCCRLWGACAHRGGRWPGRRPQSAGQKGTENPEGTPPGSASNELLTDN